MGYKDNIENEIRQYKDTDNVHDLSDAHHYVANTYLSKLFRENIGVNDFGELVVKYVRGFNKPEEDIRILSLGSGTCDFEIDLAISNKLKCKFECYEINKYMLEKAIKKTADNKLSSRFTFVESDVNKIDLTDKYDVVIANHSLHHFVELEHIFEEVNKCMEEKSVFLINDMIGKNGHEMWDDTFDVCNRIWNLLPKELKYNHLLKANFVKRVKYERMNYEKEGFEGIRAQDILELLDEYFKFKDFATFYAFVNKFVDRDFGPNYKLDNHVHKALLDLIWRFDNDCLEKQVLKPTQIVATMVKRGCEVNDYKYTYFKKPSDVYQLQDKTYLKYFDKDILTLTQPEHSGLQKLIWKTIIFAVIIFKMFIRLPHYVLKKMVK